MGDTRYNEGWKGKVRTAGAFQFMCHSEPVLTLVWESPPSSRLHSPKDGDCHASVRYFIAMTWNSGVGISPVQQAAFQNTCHSEPVLTLVWESPPSSRLHSPKDGDCHASVRYFIAMTWNSGVGISPVQQAAFQNTCHSEPVLTLVWESPPSLRPLSSIDGDCHASLRTGSQ